MSCWGKKNLKDHSAKFFRSKGSSAGDGPSPALPQLPCQSCSASRSCWIYWIILWVCRGLEHIKDRIETIRLLFSWVQPRNWIQVFRKKKPLKYNLHIVLSLSQIKGFTLVVEVYILPVLGTEFHTCLFCYSQKVKNVECTHNEFLNYLDWALPKLEILWIT